MSSESRIENQILISLSKLKNGFFWKNVSTGFKDGHAWRKQASPFAINGVSDILGIFKGRLIAFEVKTRQGRPTREQVAFIAKIQKLGGVAGVVRSFEEALQLLQAAFGHDEVSFYGETTE